MPLRDLPSWKTTPDGLVVWVSPQYVPAFGVDPTGRNVRDVFPAELAEMFLKNNAQALESGELTPEYMTALNGPWAIVKWVAQNGIGPVICGAAVRS